MGKVFRINRQPSTLNPVKKKITATIIQAIIKITGLVLALSAPLLFATDLIVPEASSGLHNEQIKILQGHQFMAVTANPYASKAAYNVLAKGGSAIDAAIAAQLVLGLVEPQSSGIGGGAFIMHWNQKTQQLSHFDGRETAPTDVDSNHFINPKGQPLSFFDAVIGGYSVGAPGVIAAMELAHQQHGKLPWEDLFTDAITLSNQGFIVSKRLNRLTQWLNQGKYSLANDKSNQALAKYLLKQGKARPVGSILKNAEYAKTLEQIAQQGSKAFYQGPIAKAIISSIHSSANPGKLSLDDLKSYRAIENRPICQSINTYKLCGAPAPSSGPISIIQQLILLNNTPNLSGLNAISPGFYHRLIETQKLSFADRNQYIADPAFTEQNSNELINIKYLSQRSKQLNLLSASKELALAGKLNQPSAYISAQSLELPSTSHLSIIDAQGNAVSMTSSIETAFGSRIMVKGFILNNQLTDFSFLPKADNQWIANRIEPGKRPRSSMSPMIILKNNKPTLLIGSPGGARIISYISKVLAQHLLLDMPLEEAINSPHISNLNKSSSTIESTPSGMEIAKQLSKLGHTIEIKAQTSGIHAIAIEPSGYTGIADLRREGDAQGQ